MPDTSADRRRKYIRVRAEYVLAGLIGVAAYESYVAAKNLSALFGDDDDLPSGGAGVGDILLPATPQVALEAAAFGLAAFILTVTLKAWVGRQQTA